MPRVLICDKLESAGIDILSAAGIEVDNRPGLKGTALQEALAAADGAIVRSGTQITGALLENAPKLRAVVRAGVGVDNIDVATATRRGVVVMNTPGGNTVSAAEHTIALMLSMARHIPTADSTMKAGKWDRSKLLGTQVAGKILGIIGLGRIGKLVAQRALAFGMKLVAYDPFVSPERARQISVELLDLDRLLAVSDFVTIHVAKTPETVNLLNAERLAAAKPGIRIINVARGGIVNEADLAEAIRNGHVAGAALDVFAKEPTTESPLFELDQVVVTPHLGASTVEAQDKAGDTIAEMVELALAGEFVPFAVNVSAAEAAETVRPFLSLAERLGAMYASLAGGSAVAGGDGVGGGVGGTVQVSYEGQIAGYDTRILTLSFLKGFMGHISEDPVSFVNAQQLASEQGVEVTETATTTSHRFVNLITVRGPEHALSATLVGLNGEARIVMVDDHKVDVPPSNHMLVVRNEDVPGVIGTVGSILGDEGVNIADLHLGQTDEGTAAMMVIAATDVVSPAVVARVLDAPAVHSVHSIEVA